ncbi:MAG TPA: NAD-dependent epimerase/dehydratase family protein [Terriglobia bacterium]|nr:NAD-dependent epimerase/dehydratase family protein [Terriglobia bacterium]
MKILVTGGNGFIGSVVVRMLRARGLAVRCLVRRTSRLDRIAHLGCELVVGDLLDFASLASAVKGCNLVIHLAGIAKWNLIHSPLMFDVVAGGTLNVLKTATDARIERMVYVSSTIALAGTRQPALRNENSRSPLRLERYAYARAKHQAEEYCTTYGDRMSVTVVNPGEVYGPNDIELVTAGNLIDFANANPVAVCNGGTSIVYVDDVAAGIIAALERGRNGQRYILAGENVTIRRLAELTNELLSLTKTYVTLPTPVVRAAAWLGRMFHVPLPFNPNVIPYATLYWFTDNSKAVRELGVRFRNAESTLLPTLEWCRSTGRVPAGRRRAA